MAASSVASPLCTWLVAAACMSVTCDGDHSTSLSLTHSPRRVSKWARRRKVSAQCSSRSSEFKRGLVPSFCGSSIHGLMSSCLAFEPCNEYYNSNGLSSFGSNGFSLLFRSRSVVTNRRQRRINRAAHSGNYFFLHCRIVLQQIFLSIIGKCSLCCVFFLFFSSSLLYFDI